LRPPWRSAGLHEYTVAVWSRSRTNLIAWLQEIRWSNRVVVDISWWAAGRKVLKFSKFGLLIVVSVVAASTTVTARNAPC
jgi:hypothetical protein